ncbi:serine hydrolase [Streptomyces sp. NPDC052020]|uniref:serine hydrolase n=1 Tax=Streptomyces sp. NPDC052020 TaxID=3155677 RepID=UPI00341F0E6C
MKVEGFVEDGYDAVRQVFQRLVDDGRETGAGLSAWRDGREVVRLGGGWADAGRGRLWRGDTLVVPYSRVAPSAVAQAHMCGCLPGRDCRCEHLIAYRCTGRGPADTGPVIDGRGWQWTCGWQGAGCAPGC